MIPIGKNIEVGKHLNLKTNETLVIAPKIFPALRFPDAQNSLRPSTQEYTGAILWSISFHRPIVLRQPAEPTQNANRLEAPPPRNLKCAPSRIALPNRGESQK